MNVRKLLVIVALAVFLFRLVRRMMFAFFIAAADASPPDVIEVHSSSISMCVALSLVGCIHAAASSGNATTEAN